MSPPRQTNPAPAITAIEPTLPRYESSWQTFQILDADGKRRDLADFAPEMRPVAALSDDLSGDQLRQMYREMAHARAFDAMATALQRTGELGLWVSSQGQEGAQVGAAFACTDQDMVFPSYREHLVVAHRGIDYAAILPVMRGTRHGGWDPGERRTHIYTFVIGAHALHAVGFAQGLVKQGMTNAAVMCFYGDGASSQGDVNEAMILAAATGAPVVFVCQNNGWAISAPTSVQSRVPLAQRAAGVGIPGLRVDGNDPLASYAACSAAMAQARAGGGPALIEAVTYRMGAHTTSDDPTRYRDPDEHAAWAKRDPLARLRAYLDSAGEADEDFYDDVAASGQALAEQARAATVANSAGDPSEMFNHVYAGAHRQVDDDARAFARWREESQ